MQFMRKAFGFFAKSYTEKQEIIERKKQEEQIKPAVEEEMLKTESDRRQIPVLGILGMALILICAGSLFYLRKQDK